MPFAIVGMLLAYLLEPQSFQFKPLILIVLAMIFARNAAMAFNRYIDREIDAKNPRTKVREIPAGIISPKNALIFVIINCLAFVITTYFINTICFFLSPIALLVVLGYSYTKRYTWLCHFVLGLGLALAPIGAYLAITGTFHILPILFGIAVLTWVGGFDVIYALQDIDFDKSLNLKSIPTKLGKGRALLFSTIIHILTAITIVIPGIISEFGSWYWIGTSLFIALLIYQHTLVKKNDLSKVNLAFFTTNGVASIVFCCFFILEYFSTK